MIRYALKCKRGHLFESWFQSADAFDRLRNAGLVSCATCGTASVEKAVMAPRLLQARGADRGPGPDGTHPATARHQPDGAGQQAPCEAPAEQAAPPDLTAPELTSPAAQALRELRRQVEARSEDVGRAFAREARAIHAGEAPRRPIIGEAAPDEARALIDDGIPVAPLPWSVRKTN